MVEDLLLYSGQDIPFSNSQILIHQPTILEIAKLGEDNFFMGYQVLNFSKDLLEEKDRVNLSEIDNFDILMIMLQLDEGIVQKKSAINFLNLLFPNCIITVEEQGLLIQDQEKGLLLCKDNFKDFKDTIARIFCLQQGVSKKDFNPKGKKAQEIADKLLKGRQQVEQEKSKGNSQSGVFRRYISILSVGLKMDLNIFLNHTVYQLYDEFKRFQAKMAFDIDLKARLAGATELQEVDDWMEDFYS